MVVLPCPSLATFSLMPPPEATNVLAAGGLPALNVMVLPSTGIVSPSLIVAVIESVDGLVTNLVLLLGVVVPLALVITEPVSMLAAYVTFPSRLAAVAPAPRLTEMFDLVVKENGDGR